MDILQIFPNLFSLESSPVVSGTELTLPGRSSFATNNTVVQTSDITLDLDTSGNWDDTSYSVAATRAGKDINVYSYGGGLLLSVNDDAPDGLNTSNSRKIMGLHALCNAVGTISGHQLSGLSTGDILPASVWHLLHHPVCSPIGMVWSEEAQIWVDIYLQSGSGSTAASAYNGVPTVSRTWLDFVDDLGAFKKRLLTDAEFQLIAEGSNQETNIQGSANPGTTGGHVDTAGRRMVSDTGVEDCCGLVWQWLAEQSYRILSMPDTGDPAYSYYNLPGARGSAYHQGGQGDVKLRGGGAWSDGSQCGSRARTAYNSRWDAISYVGARGCAHPSPFQVNY